MISSGYRWRCPTSILASVLRVISQPSTCDLAESCFCVRVDFSKEELIQQLEYDGFTNEEAVYGVTANGY